MVQTSKFLDTLEEKLVKERGVVKTTVNKYFSNLTMMNDGVSPTSLAYLKKTDVIEKKLEGKTDNTKKSYYSSFVSVLSLFKTVKGYKSPLDYYTKRMNEISDANKEKLSLNEKNEKQTENWVDWKDIIDIKNSLSHIVDRLVKKDKLTIPEYNQLLSLVVLSLYTDIPPRRNMDYQHMDVIKNGKEESELSSQDMNYLDWERKLFIFNKYKISKLYGNQVTKIPDELDSLFASYFKFHPLADQDEFPFLVDYSGNRLASSNGITRILNKIFKKKVGVSMLRHIYLSNKYGTLLDEMKNDSKAMAHSLDMQREYIKN